MKEEAARNKNEAGHGDTTAPFQPESAPAQAPGKLEAAGAVSAKPTAPAAGEVAEGQLSRSLSAEERSEFKRLVGRFQELQGAWHEGLEILLEIKERRLYREGHDNFEEFCRKEFGMGRSNINRCLRSAEVAQNLGTIVSKPTREAHIRPLLKLPDADKQVACYRQALAVAEAEDRPLKASDVASAVRTVLPPETSRPTVPVGLAPVDLLKAISRAVTKELEKYPVDVLGRFQDDVTYFKDDWFKRNVGLAQGATTVAANDHPGVDAGNLDEHEADASSDDDAPEVEDGVLATGSDRAEYKLAHPVAVPGMTPAGASGQRTDQRVFDHAPQPRRRYDAIAVEVAPDVTFADLGALKLHRLMETRCHLFLKFSGEPPMISGQAFARNTLWTAGKFALVMQGEPASASGKPSGGDTVLVLINGDAQNKDRFKIEPVYMVTDPEHWFEAVLDTPGGLFPDGLPEKVLAVKVTPATSSTAAPGGKEDSDVIGRSKAPITEQQPNSSEEKSANADE